MTAINNDLRGKKLVQGACICQQMLANEMKFCKMHRMLTIETSFLRQTDTGHNCLKSGNTPKTEGGQNHFNNGIVLLSPRNITDII